MQSYENAFLMYIPRHIIITIINDLLVRVTPNCPTAVVSLREEECKDEIGSDSEMSGRIFEFLRTCASGMSRGREYATS